MYSTRTPKITQEYKEVNSNKYVTTVHPPKTSLITQDNYLAVRLATGKQIDKEDSKELTKDVIYQNNYWNEILNTMSQ